MKKLILPILLFSLVMVMASGILIMNMPRKSPQGPRVIMETFDPTLFQYEDAWKNEIGRRFDHAVGILVHGGDFVQGEWIVGASDQPWAHVRLVSELVERVQKEYPDRTVVLLACNPGHLHLGIRGVYYSSSNVWCVPDRAVNGDMGPQGYTRWELIPDTVGNIYEFVTD